MKIIIIKLGAKGDVIRTLPLAEAIKKKYPLSEITWVTKENIISLLEGNPYIDKLYSLPFNSKENYDILYNFDIEEEAINIVKKINAEMKYGFFSEGGFPTGFNLGAEYYLNTLFDDEIKKYNKKTYQEMMFEAADLPYFKEMPRIYLTNKDKIFAENFLKEKGINKDKLIGIHMGAGARWPSKAWSKEKIKEFITKAYKKSYQVLLFGGPEEVGKVDNILSELEQEGIIIHKNNPNNSNKEFASLVNICKKMICSDSFSLHVSLALGKPTIGLFFCTPPDEVESYGLLKKIISPLIKDFFPEKMDQYSKDLVNSISSEEVLNAL